MGSFSRLGIAKQALSYVQHFTTEQIQQLAVLDNDSLEVIFSSASILRMSVIEEKTPTKFEVEDGTNRSDHVVVKPVEIQIDFALATKDDKGQLEEMRDYFNDNLLVTIQTRLNSYSNMLIIALPQEQDTRIGATIAMRLEEWRPIVPEFGSAVANKSQTNTKKRGTIQGVNKPEPRGSILSRWGIL